MLKLYVNILHVVIMMCAYITRSHLHADKTGHTAFVFDEGQSDQTTVM